MSAVQLMLDSGAFGAWSHGETIDLDKYIEYIKENADWLFSYVTLDVLPEGRESARTEAETERCAALSYENTQRMKDVGLAPIPVFHQGEHERWLQRMLADGEPYIGVSTRKDLPTKDLIEWLDRVFHILAGRPEIKVHGFGITATKLLRRYPFYSVDSTTWSVGSGFGQFLIPKMKDREPGNYNWQVEPYSVVLSSRVQGSAAQEAKRFEYRDIVEREHIRHFLDEEVGISLAEARNGGEGRRRAMLEFYRQFGEQRGVKIMFATLLNNQLSKSLTDAGINTRLLSYYDLQRRPSQLLRTYVEIGKLSENYEQRIPKRDWEAEEYLSYRKLKLHFRNVEYSQKGEETFGKPTIS